ncbi:MAG TPA: MMPL family transporter [Solirubrobacteraceae bacterium]|nr:MMPL family transporter [Solirubrobacteraceae bacterium]
MLQAVARTCVRRRFVVLGVWLVATIALVAISHRMGDNTNDNLSLPGTNSQQATDTLSHSFPAQANGTSPIVVHTAKGKLTDSQNADAINQAAANLGKQPDVASVVNPVTPEGASALAKDQTTGYLSVTLAVSPGSISQSEAQSIIASAAKPMQAAGLQVETGGQLGQKVSKPATESSELIGIVAAMVILAVTFGTITAMLLPIVTAIFGLLATLAIVRILGHVLTVPSVAPTLATMIGLGVGIDYALFIVTRFRQGLGEGRSPREAVVQAMATSGRAVLFAGTTVLISLLGLLLIGQEYLDGLAVGTMLAVLAVMAGALTLLPAMLGFAGTAIDRLHVPGLLQTVKPGLERGFWWRWSRTVQRYPVRCGAVAFVVLVVLALPLFSMRLAFTDSGNDPTTLTTRQAYDLITAGFGPGFNGRLVLAAELPRGARDHALLGDIDDKLARVSDVARVAPPLFNALGNAAVVIVYPTTAPQAAATSSLVTELRASVIPAATAGTDVRVLVGGETAAGIDASSQLSQRLPLVIGLVILLSFVLLMLVFRSIAIPLKAAAMNLLSIGAAYGAIVAVYQWGWLAAVFGVSRTGPIDPWIPLMMFTITFGLSMDYEVFLLSRVQESWRSGVGNSIAVADGIATTGRVITAAAAIMVCVFGSFVVGDPLRILDVFGLGLAVAILVDATLVRMVLVPSIMQLLGNANWWFPARLGNQRPAVELEKAATSLATVPIDASG